MKKNLREAIEDIKRTVSLMSSTVVTKLSFDYTEDRIEFWCELYDPLFGEHTFCAECELTQQDFDNWDEHMINVVTQQLCVDYLEAAIDQSTIH